MEAEGAPRHPTGGTIANAAMMQRARIAPTFAVLTAILGTARVAIMMLAIMALHAE